MYDMSDSSMKLSVDIVTTRCCSCILALLGQYSFEVNQPQWHINHSFISINRSPLLKTLSKMLVRLHVLDPLFKRTLLPSHRRVVRGQRQSIYTRLFL